MRNRPFRFLEVDAGGQTFKLRSGYHYSADGVWVRIRGGCPCMGRVARIGVSEPFASHGQNVEAVTLPERDTRVQRGDIVAKIAAGGREWAVASPISGKVIAVNTLLETEPQWVGRDAYDVGWLAILRPARPTKVDTQELFTAEEYGIYVTNEKRAEAGPAR